MHGRESQEGLIGSSDCIDQTTSKKAGTFIRVGAWQQESLESREQAVPPYLQLRKYGAKFLDLLLFKWSFVGCRVGWYGLHMHPKSA